LFELEIELSGQLPNNCETPHS